MLTNVFFPLTGTFMNPLCVRDKAKALLTTAIWNDTLFLSSLSVMDYSLVVGYDNKNNCLVVGIIGTVHR